MIAILELCNRGGFKVKVNFRLNENLLVDTQVNQISGNFTDIKSATLTLKGNEDQLIIREYELIKNRLLRRWHHQIG